MEIVLQELWEKMFCLYLPPYMAVAGLGKAISLGNKRSLVLR